MLLVAASADSVARCPDVMVALLEIVQTISDLVGMAAISGALVVASVRWIVHEFRLIRTRCISRERWEGLRDIRLFLGNYILLGLEFVIVSDIIHSFLVPDIHSLMHLGLIVVVRTLISFFLGKELEAVRHEAGSSSTETAK